MSQNLDPSRGARASVISLLGLMGAAALVWCGERPQLSTETAAPSAPTLPSAAAPKVTRVMPTDFEEPKPEPPAGSVTLELYKDPAPGLVLTELEPTGAASPRLEARLEALPDHVPPVEPDAALDFPSEPASRLAGQSALLDFSVMRKGVRYAASLRGRCASAPDAPASSCRLALMLNGTILARLEFGQQVSIQSTLFEYTVLHPGGNRISLTQLLPEEPKAAPALDQSAEGGAAAAEPVAEPVAQPRPAARGDLLVTHLSLMPVSDRLELNIGTPEARPYLESGFHNDEADGNRRSVWSSGLSSSIALVLEPAPEKAYEVKLLAHALPGLAPLTLRASLNGKPLGTRKLGPGWGYHSFPISPRLLRPGANRLELHYPTTARPVDTEPGSNDTRSVAIRLERLWLSPTR